MRSLHCMAVPLEFCGQEIEVNVEYTYSPGFPACTPPGEYAAIDPPEPPEADIVTMKSKSGFLLPPEFVTAAKEDAESFILDHHQEPGRDPDAAREAQRDDEAFFSELLAGVE